MEPNLSLTTCTACGKQVSSQATACPHCGQPLRAAVEPIQESGYTVQLTTKKWKKVKLAAAALLLLGIGMLFTEYAVFGGILLFAGIVVLIVGKMGAWWSTG